MKGYELWECVCRRSILEKRERKERTKVMGVYLFVSFYVFFWDIVIR